MAEMSRLHTDIAAFVDNKVRCKNLFCSKKSSFTLLVYVNIKEALFNVLIISAYPAVRH